MSEAILAHAGYLDKLYDGQRTGRYRWDQLRKTEKTYMGTLVEIDLHREFEFGDGVAMDYRIAGVDVDCRFSQSLGGWEFPPEAYEGNHLCLVIWANEEAKRFEAGLVRVSGAIPELLGPPNRDRKRKLTPAGESRIRWLYDAPELLRRAAAATAETAGVLVLGAAYGAGLWALQRYAFLPINTPADRLFTTGLISPQWVWWIAQLALGATIGLTYLLLERRRPATALQSAQPMHKLPAERAA